MADKRILVRAGKHPFTPVNAEASLGLVGRGIFAGNVGNYMYSETAIKAVSVPGVEIVPTAMVTERAGAGKAHGRAINEQFDRLVLPMANAFRPDYANQLRLLTSVISQLDIPVNIVGIGGQFSLGGGRSELPEMFLLTVKRFVRTVLDRSASIGVRGEITKEFLLQLGFPDDAIDVIGCPSLSGTSTPLPVLKPQKSLPADAKIALSLTPQIKHLVPFIDKQMADHPNLIYITQTKEDLRLLLWGEAYPAKYSRDLPVHWNHPLYLNDQMRFPLDRRTWIDYLKEFDFVYGTRMHGTIAPLLGGTPAMLVAHDSRTLELAEFHGIPFTELHPDTEPRSAAELYEEADFTEFNARRIPVFENFLAFMHKNGIDTIYDHKGAEAKWDAKLEAAPLPPVVHTLMHKGDDAHLALVQRLAWLGQNIVSERFTSEALYRPPFRDGAPDHPGYRSTRQAIANLSNRVAVLESPVRVRPGVVARVRKRLGRLKRKWAGQSRRKKSD